MIAPADFRDALTDFPSGVTIVTSADAEGVPLGATVSAFTSLSLDPPLILVCLNKSSRSMAAIASRRAFAVHFLDRSQATLARRFAIDAADKFAGATFAVNEAGVPCLADCRLRLECSLQSEYDGGDHVILVGLVEASQKHPGFEPLLYARRSFFALGSEVEVALNC